MQNRDLFGNILKGEVNLINYPWSHSRINFLDSCPLKYFYQYYAAKGRTAKNIPGKKRIAFLSHLATKHLIVGTIIHDAIDNYFKCYKNGLNYDLAMILNWAFQKLEDIYRLTERARSNPDIQFKNGEKIFKELYYKTVDATEFKLAVEEKIKICLTNFYKAEEFEGFRRAGKLKSSSLEKWIIFKIMGYAAVKGKLDLSFETEANDYILVDWKTGNIENEETSLQLLVYAIWAIENQKINAQKIKLFKAYLQETRVEPLEFSEDNILRAKMRVIHDTEMIEKLHGYGVNGNIAAFSRIDFPNKICPQCPFEELCHKTIANENTF